MVGTWTPRVACIVGSCSIPEVTSLELSFDVASVGSMTKRDVVKANMSAFM
jgi:hypothetical protein